MAKDLGVDADTYARVRQETVEQTETGGTGGPQETLVFFARRAGVQPQPGALKRGHRAPADPGLRR